jgi:hypothetical protein
MQCARCRAEAAAPVYHDDLPFHEGCLPGVSMGPDPGRYRWHSRANPLNDLTYQPGGAPPFVPRFNRRNRQVD